MNPVIEKILSQVYELEGLLLVIDRHKGDTSPFIYEMIQKKVERLNEIVPQCTPDIYGEKLAAPMPLSETIQDHEVVESVDENSNENPIQEEIDALDDDIVDYVNDEDIVDVIEDDNYIDVEPIDDIIESEDSTPIVDEAETCEIENFNANDLVESDICFDDDSECLNPEEENEDNITDEYEIENSYDVENDLSEDDESLKLDEVLQRNISKDLSKAFTLNDRFRYRRELFGNSEVEMCNTINMIEAMQSFAEAEDYFYGDLEWDKDSPEVADFMTIIKNHFL